MYFTKRKQALLTTITLTFITLIAFNNCGEGFKSNYNELSSLNSNIRDILDPKPNLTPEPRHLHVSHNKIKLASNRDPGLKARYILNVYKNMYAIALNNKDTNSKKMIYGSFNDLKNNTYREVIKPDLSSYLIDNEIDSESFAVRDYTNTLDINNQSYKKIYYYADLKSKADNSIYTKLTYVYYQNIDGTLSPKLIITNKPSQTNIESIFSISLLWKQYITKSEEWYIESQKLNKRINVTASTIISEDENWYIDSIGQSGCYAINLKNNSTSIYLGPLYKDSLTCPKNYFLTNNVVLHNYLGYLSPANYKETTKEDLIVVDLRNGNRYPVRHKYFSFDYKNNIITYYNKETNTINRQFLDDFLDKKTPTVSIPTVDFMNKLQGYDNYPMIWEFDKFFALAIPSHHQDTAIINNLTGEINVLTELQSLFRNNKFAENEYFFPGFTKIDNKYYIVNYDKLELNEIIYSQKKQPNPTLPEYECEVSLVPKSKLSETCIWELVKSGNSYKNFFKFNVRFPLKSETLNIKERWIYLPPGTSIDNSDEDNWIYPKGTIFYKNFAYSDSETNNTSIEMRILEKTSNATGTSAWRPSVYIWNEDQTEAYYNESGRTKEITHNNHKYKYSIPSKNACIECHRGNNDMVAGFKHLQLSFGLGDFDRIKSYYNKGLLSKEPTNFEDIPTLTPSDNNSTYNSKNSINVIGLLNTNCAGCHSPNGVASNAGLDFTYKLGTTLHSETRAYKTSIATGKAIPGDHKNSLLFKHVESGYMPKGSKNPYVTLANLLKDWIDNLPPVND